MRQVSNYGDKMLREEQLGVLIEIIAGLKNKSDIKYFIENFLTDSEKAYLGQRLNVMRMLSKYFSYQKIKEKLKVSITTISNTNKLLENAGDRMCKLVLLYKFKPVHETENLKTASKPLVKPHYPGAIKL